MQGTVSFDLELNSLADGAVRIAGKGGIPSWVKQAFMPVARAIGGIEVETLRIGRYEYRVLAAGDWELGRLHDYIHEQEGLGWQVDSAFGMEEELGENGAAALQLWLRRERQAMRKAS